MSANPFAASTPQPAGFVPPLTNGTMSGNAWASHAIGASILGVLLVTLPLDTMILLLMIAAVSYVFTAIWINQRVGPSAANKFIVLHLAILAAILIVALWTPVKERDRAMNSRVRLPKAAMTMGELVMLADQNRQLSGGQSFELPLRISVAPANQNKVIRWPSNEMSLQEFLDGAEAQSNLKRQFITCGNATTVLWGVGVGTLSLWEPGAD